MHLRSNITCCNPSSQLNNAPFSTARASAIVGSIMKGLEEHMFANTKLS
jgi:hypothetical protein